jgi:hypothetical protein
MQLAEEAVRFLIGFSRNGIRGQDASDFLPY